VAPVLAFRLVWERAKHIGATSQPHSDFLCFPEAAGGGAFHVGSHRLTHSSAGMRIIRRRRDTAPAVTTVRIDGTY
jgi:hypothetical protein